MTVYGHPDLLKARLVNRIRTKRQPTTAQRFFRWMRGMGMYNPDIIKLNIRRPSSVVTAYCQRCSDFYDPDLGCRCLMVMPPKVVQQQEVVYAALAPEFNETLTNQMP